MSTKDHDENLVMDRAEEVAYQQSRQAQARPEDVEEPPLPPGDFLQPEAELLARRFRLAAWLRAASGAAALAAALTLFASALYDSGRVVVWPRIAGWLGEEAATEPLDIRPGQMYGVTIMADCRPRGASVVLNGTRRGTCPAIISHECRVGEPVRIELQRAGFSRWHRVWTCGDSSIIKVRATLKRTP